MAGMTDEFYIGYETPVPRGWRRHVFGAVAGALAVSVAAAAVMVATQAPLASSRFEYGGNTVVPGIMRVDPYPRLVTTDGDYLIVGFGKRSAAAAVRAYDGQAVRLSGALIERGRHRMLELNADSIVHLPAGEPPGSEATADLGEVSLKGEIVDGKCYLGVMNPGEGHVHRDCARACLRGGLPALFAVRTDDGRELLITLVAPGGGPASAELADLAGKPITLRGRLRYEPAHERFLLQLTPLP